MEIKAGKYYRTRDGRKVGPMKLLNKSDQWKPTEISDFSLSGKLWDGEGRRYYKYKKDQPEDLVAEWTDEPAAPKTWGEMTDLEKGALLLANHEGKVIEKLFPVAGWREMDGPAWRRACAYRVRPPEPVHETKRLRLINEGGRCVGHAKLDYIDGKSDPDSIRMERIND